MRGLHAVADALEAEAFVRLSRDLVDACAGTVGGTGGRIADVSWSDVEGSRIVGVWSEEASLRRGDAVGVARDLFRDVRAILLSGAPRDVAPIRVAVAMARGEGTFTVRDGTLTNVRGEVVRRADRMLRSASHDRDQILFDASLVGEVEGVHVVESGGGAWEVPALG